MMKDTETMKKTLYRPFVGLLIAFIILFGIGFGAFGILLPKIALATENFENAYVRFEKFYYNSTDDLIVEFFCKTTFNAISPWGSSSVNAVGINWYVKYTPAPAVDNLILGIEPDLVNNQFVAGNTYKLYLKYFKKVDTGPYQNYYLTKATWEAIKGSNMDATDTIKNAMLLWNVGVYDNSILAYFSETPTLNITFPFENAEISQAFNITGSYTIPENSGITRLIAFFYAGSLPYPWYSYDQRLDYLSGDVDIRVSGIQADENYTIEFCFVGTGIEAICLDDQNIHISILSAIAPELPETHETPPEFFDTIDFDKFYLDFSAYDTPTAMATTLKNAIQPLFTTIGSNLVFFSSNFDQQTAKETGEKTGQAILTIRSYSSNLNTFFNDLPVSEFLLFYLGLLIIVIVFRIIKNLINLIKP